MITSLIDLLRDCLPIHAAWTEAEMLSGKVGEVPPAGNLKRLMQAQAPGASAVVPTQPLPSNDPQGWWQKVKSNFGLSAAVLSTRLWSWTLQGPNKVVEMNCRAREAGYRLHAVLPKVTFGLNGDPKVKLATASGQDLELPLSADFLYAQFFVQGGTIPKGKRTLWPLEALHDSGIVLVFIYEPDFDASGKIKLPLSPFHASGAGNWEPVRPEEKTLLEGLAPSVPDTDGWLEAMTGPFMNVPGGGQQTAAKTNDTKTTKVVRPRIVIALSMATCRERADFEPGGLVGMAKIFPTLMVCSALPLLSLEGTVKIERTPATTPLDNGNGALAAGTTCCGALQECGAILVADANEIGSLSQKPFWGGTFAYVEPQANARFAGQRLRMVDRTKMTNRKYDRGTRLLVRRETGFFSKEYWSSLFGLRSQEMKGVEKVPGQGEFDNLHLAPNLKLDLAKWVYMPPSGDAFFPPSPMEYKVDPAACHTDKVWMAPFCSHDCFHTHVRWGAKESAEWTFGWNETGPYKVAGAPMVPLYQDVWLELHGPSSYSYHAKSSYGHQHVPGTWDVLMHHGAAYAQSIADWMKFAGSQFNIGFEQSNTFFYNSAGKMLSLDHAPLMYWLFRYQVDGRDDKVFVTERVQFTEGEIDGARAT
jgi:hypothetical protein